MLGNWFSSPDFLKLHGPGWWGCRGLRSATARHRGRTLTCRPVPLFPFVKKHLQLEDSVPVTEKDLEPLIREELTVWEAAHPKPSGRLVGGPHEQAVAKWFAEDAFALSVVETSGINAAVIVREGVQPAGRIS